MIDMASLLLLFSLGAVALAWMVPDDLALDAVALWTAMVLLFLSPLSALWLIAVTVLTPLALRLGDWSGQRNLVAGAAALMLTGAFVAARLTSTVEWIGGAFFTLRALHVVGDWWMGRLATPSLRAHGRYQLFLPVILSGPIHRFEHFERQAERRRIDAAQLFAGAERTLLGAFSAFVIGNWAVGRLAGLAGASTQAWNDFARTWLLSAIDWAALYFIFAGLSAMALGMSLMIGLKLEENFGRPWAARNLVDFWMRWHISLTSWVRDYVFRPVAAMTRNVLAGLVAAMLVIGLWHEFSAYYVLWSFWQVLGVLLTRLAMRWLPLDDVPFPVRAVAGPLLVLGWLSLARPVILTLLETIG